MDETSQPSKFNFLGIMYIILASISGYSIYVIFNEFVSVAEGTNAKQDMEQLSVLISVFYILILITSFYVAILLFKNRNGTGDPHHVLILILNSFLFFYGFISVIPTAIAVSHGATEAAYAPIITSVFSLLLGAGVTIYYTSKGSETYLQQK